jgi:hypothetical protein
MVIFIFFVLEWVVIESIKKKYDNYKEGQICPLNYQLNPRIYQVFTN